MAPHHLQVRPGSFQLMFPEEQTDCDKTISDQRDIGPDVWLRPLCDLSQEDYGAQSQSQPSWCELQWSPNLGAQRFSGQITAKLEFILLPAFQNGIILEPEHFLILPRVLAEENPPTQLPNMLFTSFYSFTDSTLIVYSFVELLFVSFSSPLLPPSPIFTFLSGSRQTRPQRFIFSGGSHTVCVIEFSLYNC